MTTDIKRRAFSVDEYHAMVDAGILTKYDRVELLDGEIIAMVPIGSGHASCVMRLLRMLNEVVGERAIVSVQGPVWLDEASEPEPDLMLLKWRDDFYAAAHPTPADVLLLIEVSDATVAFDKNVKLPLYARAVIPEVWIVNLPDRAIEVYSTPVGPEYTESRSIGMDGALSPACFEDVSLQVGAVIPG